MDLGEIIIKVSGRISGIKREVGKGWKLRFRSGGRCHRIDRQIRQRWQEGNKERVVFGGGGYGSGLVTIGRSGGGGGRHNAGLPDFFACQMTEKPWGVHGRGLWVDEADGGCRAGTRWYERRALFGNNADTRLHPHLHSSP